MSKPEITGESRTCPKYSMRSIQEDFLKEVIVLPPGFQSQILAKPSNYRRILNSHRSPSLRGWSRRAEFLPPAELTQTVSSWPQWQVSWFPEGKSGPPEHPDPEHTPFAVSPAMTQGNATLILVLRTNSAGDSPRGYMKMSSESISLNFWVDGGTEIRTRGLSFNFSFCFWVELCFYGTKFRRDYSENKSSHPAPSDSPVTHLSSSEATSFLCIFLLLVIAYMSNTCTYIPSFLF